MKNTAINSARLLALLVAGVLVTTAAIAEKPEWAGGGKHGHSKQKEKHNDNHERDDDSRDRHENRDRRFDVEQRTLITTYYSNEYRKGRCPPGLAKKHNGCLPPGQARQWSVGRPLPSNVVYYDLPPAISVQIGLPPAGHRYVRVASDILLIAVGTSMVVDGIENLGR
jgi:Ni/Co efflux regulator RcnB